MRGFLAGCLLLLAASASAQIRYEAPGGTFTGGTLTSPLLLPDGTAAAPGLAFASDVDGSTPGLYRVSSTAWGWSSGASKSIEWDAGGSFTLYPGNTNPQVSVSAYGLNMYANALVSWSSSTTSHASGRDLYLYRDAANTLALRNSTSAQTFNIYNTYTSASDYERGSIGWTSNEFLVGTSAATGTQRSLVLHTGVGTGTGAGDIYLKSADRVFFYIDGANSWFIQNVSNNADKSFGPAVTDAFDLGEETRQIKEFYVSRSIQGSKSKALADASATEFVRVSIPQTAGSNYAGGNVEYTVMARKGSDIQVLSGEAKFSCINNAGTESCAAIVESYKTAAVVTAGTLTCAITAVTGLTDAIGLAANCDTSLTATLDGFTIEYRLDMPHINTVTPQ